MYEASHPFPSEDSESSLKLNLVFRIFTTGMRTRLKKELMFMLRSYAVYSVS